MASEQVSHDGDCSTIVFVKSGLLCYVLTFTLRFVRTADSSKGFSG